jgi:poly(3-hydroxybutyrate) depolymerase
VNRVALLRASLTTIALFALLWASPAAAQRWDRDEWLDSPVDDATFESFLDFFAYDSGLAFEVEVISTEQREGVEVQQLSFQSTSGMRVTATLFRPQADPATQLPAVIAAHGGVPEGKRSVSHFGPIVARAGWMYLAIDLLHFGDRDTGLFETFMNPEKAERLYNVPSQYLQWVTQTVKDTGRSYDFLVGERNADPARVVLLGVSRGGQLSLILGGADSRLAGVAALIAGHFDALETGHRAPACPANYIGRIAPRPLLTINGTSDPDYDRELSVEPLHALAGDSHDAHWLETGHSVPLEESMALLVDWLGRVPQLER